MDFELLHRIYRFPGWDIPEDQGEETCIKLSSLFTEFSKHMSQKGRHGREPKSGHSKGCYDFTFECLNLMQSSEKSPKYMECTVTQEKYLAPSINWFPAYGCAVLIHTSPGQWSDLLSIDVIGLDGHNLEVHRGEKAYQYTSVAKTYAQLHVGNIPIDEKSEYIDSFQRIFEMASSRNGDGRSAAGGKQGHQKTPSFIQAVLLQALIRRDDYDNEDDDNAVVRPKGGLTDVGLHTGGQKRDTCYDLARSVFQFFLDQGSVLDDSFSDIFFEAVMIHFHMYILENAYKVLFAIGATVYSVSVRSKVNPKVEYVFHILKHVALLAAHLSDDDHDLQEYYERMKSIRGKIEKSISNWDKANLKKYSLIGMDFNPHAPKIEIPEFIPPLRASELSPITLQNAIEQNVGSFTRPRSRSNFKEIAKWATHEVEKEIGKSYTKIFVFMREIENVFWGICENNLGNEPLPIPTIEHVVTMIESYRKAVWVYFKSESVAKSALAKQIQSVEFLLIWVGYCAVFHSVQLAHPSMEGFGVALDYKDLKYLVLHDATHLMVMEKIAQFLHLNHVENSELFSMRDNQNWNSSTFNFASKYVDSNIFLKCLLKVEKETAQKRVQEHWDEVVEKKKKAQSLREEIKKVNSELEDAKERQGQYGYYYHLEIKLRDKIEKLEESKMCTWYKLNEALKAPPPVIQPLPQDDTKAKKVLFFLEMPGEFRYLSNLTFVAQQQLVPKSWTGTVNRGGDPVNLESIDVFEELVVKQTNHDWKCHYDYQSYLYKADGEYPRQNTSGVGLSMHQAVPQPRNIGPSRTNDFTCPSEGVWYPDQSNVRLVWNGGKYSWGRHSSGSEFNPFKINSDVTASYFTEELGEEFSNLQWSLIVNGEDLPLNHGNEPYAAQNLKPSLLSKEGFIDYCSIRRFPLMALRKICSVMKRGSLPLQYDFVQKLIRQTLYQVGELCCTRNEQGDPELKMRWRDNALEEILEAFGPILEAMSDDQMQRPHIYKASAIIGEIASYFSFLSDKYGLDDIDTFKSISLNLAQAAMNWGDKYDDQIQTASPENRPSLRSKQVIFFRTAILCVVHGEIDDITAEIILRCIVRAKNSFVRDDDESIERSSLQDQCEYYLADKLQNYLDIFVQNQGIILSKILADVISSAPKSLVWTREAMSNVSFTAKGPYAQNYSINCLTGMVLVNGLPPNQLPASITEHKMYQKVFSKNNFEVTMREGFFETTQRVFGCYYRFQTTTSTLVIHESAHEEFSNSTDPWENPLELLDFNTIRCLETLPKKLQTSFSHWVCRNHGAILFRPFDFRMREIYYVYDAHLKMKYVPEYLSERKNWRLLNKGDMESLVLHDSKFLDTLERFESRCMMLTRCTTGLEYRIHLHRFALEFRFSQDCEKLLCSEIAGYHLRPNQHLKGHLRGLHQYLVLDSDDKKKTKIIIPFGEIQLDMNEGIKISVLTSDNGNFFQSQHKAEEHLAFYTYEIHPRFGFLIANSLSARLFLAGLYLATGTSIPDIEIGMTGEAKAIELLRRCMVNRPLSGEEEQCLQNVKTLSESLSPTSYIICHDIERNSINYSFLHKNSDDEGQNRSDSIRFSDKSTAYVTAIKKPLSPRLFLDEEECQRCLGRRDSSGRKRSHRAIRQLLDVENCPVERQIIIREVQDVLSGLWEEVEIQTSPSAFPLQTSDETPLEQQIFGELEKSWKLYNQKKKVVLKPEVFRTVYKLKDLIAHSLEIIEEYLNVALNGDPNSQRGSPVHCRTRALQFLRLVDIIPLATRHDMMTIACHRAQIKNFNPLLSPRAQEKIFNAILLWLELCVESDKIDYLLSFDPSSDLNEDPTFIEELAASRKWDIVQHPYWLVFEAEQRIRIRPEQYEVANHLIQNNGAAIQLNMGRGKTRVILPMLILYWSFSNKVKHTARLIILSALLREGCDYFHNALCGGHLGRRLYVLPFQRDVELDNRKVRLLKDMINHCKRERGFFVLAPEHRLSLELKVKELHLSGRIELSKELKRVVSNSWCDIIDEVDEVLHHRFQLIYSIGAVIPLPQGNHRWEVIEALLGILKNARIEGVQVYSSGDNKEAYPRICIDDNIDVPKFRQHLAQILFSDPPDRLNWLEGHCKNDLISSIVVLPEADPAELHLSEEHLNDVLSLRGLLAFDILLHSLRKRHRVDFGVNKEGRKKLSIPFRGADTPSIRAQFSHPDCAILFTILAYYDHGLDRCQTKKAFEVLLKKGKNARSIIYNEWLNASECSMEKNMYESVSNANKIDLTNTAQFEVLFKHFSRNPGTIHLWLNACVFPSELDQYPQRLVANSWQLAHHSKSGNHCVGFSGTNDNHQILPLQIKQHLPWNTSNKIWSSLLATNGRMLDVMMENTILCEELGDGKSYEKLLMYITSCKNKERRIDALIDSGALLAGNSNFSVAERIRKEYLIGRKSMLKGVTFFNEETKAWMILEASGRCMKRDQSPLNERDTFALFDEPRCRGVDLKLRPDAIAVLTLGQSICKDKLMQAAGRMRQLSRGQKIIILGETKVFNEIRRVEVRKRTSKINKSFPFGGPLRDGVISQIRKSDVRIRHVLSWVMDNTTNSIWKGLHTWSAQGMFHATTTEPEHAVLDETTDLQAFYGKPIQEMSVADLAVSEKVFHSARTGGGDEQLMEEITKRCKALGTSYKIMKTDADEECEREIEREVEEELEKEVVYSKMKARNEVDWNYHSILISKSVRDLPIKVYHFSVMIQSCMSCESLVKIKWSRKVFCTRNFIKTIASKGKIDDFLRIPDSLVHFPSGEILLLSDREANQFLPGFQACSHTLSDNGFYFGHYAFEIEQRFFPFLRCGRKELAMPELMTCSLKLFNGETMYPGYQAKVLKNMLSGAMEGATSGETFNLTKASGEPEHLVSARRKDADFDCSDLQKICSQLACEAEIS